jgi:Domain of unknown function (DUF4180)
MAGWQVANCSPFGFLMSDTDRIIIASESGITIQSLGDISDAIGECFGARGLVLTESDVSKEFFDLKTRLAGELFQKFVNYQIRLAIVLTNPSSYGWERSGHSLGIRYWLYASLNHRRTPFQELRHSFNLWNTSCVLSSLETRSFSMIRLKLRLNAN